MARRRQASLIAACTLLLGVLPASCGCSGCTSDAPVAAAADAGTSGAGGDAGVPPWDAGQEDDAGISDDCDGPQPERPSVVPEGWKAWTCSPGCPLWLPPNEASMPPEIEWEPCEGQPEAGLECQQMVADWPSDSYKVGFFPKLDVAPDGTPNLMFERNSLGGNGSPESYRDFLVVAVDGSVRFALRQPVPKGGGGCSVMLEDFNEGILAARMRGDGNGDAMESPFESLIVVDRLGDSPTLPLLEDDQALKTNWSSGRKWLVGYSVPGSLVQAYDTATFGEPVFLTSPADDPDGLSMSGRATVVGDSVFMTLGSLNMDGIIAYDEVLGYHPFVRWFGDTSRGAANLGSDGIDMVWSEGEGKPPGDGIYPVRRIMTAPFTTDPDKLEARRLRSDLSGLFGLDRGKFKVGCGYAGHDGAVPQDKLIVRIEDGWSWELKHTDDWKWGRVLGFTCEEVFIGTGTVSGTITRVRLDSLGPGIPPD